MALRILSALGCPERAELSVLIIDDAAIQEINRDYLERDRPTNVISFSQQEGETPVVPGAEVLLGDVVISADTASRDAQEAGIYMFAELVFLLLHGILHLLGYDHERGTQEDAKRMEAKEQEIYALLQTEGLI
ncbi:MAG: rRNA maturation RNase YbeY [Desulfuromonadaceae bacterium]